MRAAQAGFEVAGRLAVFQPSRRRLILLGLLALPVTAMRAEPALLDLLGTLLLGDLAGPEPGVAGLELVERFSLPTT
jgi:hypothetical protein